MVRAFAEVQGNRDRLRPGGQPVCPVWQAHKKYWARDKQSMRERTRLRGERGTFHSPRALPTPSRPVLVIALHFVFAGYAAYLLGHSPRAKTFFYRQKTEAATAIYSFYGTGANGQLSQAQVVQKLYNAIHRVNHYPVDSAIGFLHIFPLDSGKQRYPTLNNWGLEFLRN